MNNSPLTRKYRNSIIAVLCVFASCNCMGAVDGALGKIAEALNVSPTTALYCGSVPAIMTMVASLTIGMQAGSRIRYRTMTVIGGVCMLVGGIVPTVIHSFALLLVFRGLFGFGAGALLSIENPLATILLEEEGLRARILGYGTSVGFAFQMLMQFLGGVLADVRWNYVFLVHILLFVPIVLALRYTPDIPLIGKQDAQAEGETASSEGGSGAFIPLVVILICVMMGINGVLICPLLLGSAFYVGAISDSATLAGLIAVMYSLGNMIGGLIYPHIHKRLGDWGYTVYLLVMAGGLFISASARTIPTIAFGFIFGGVGNACQIPAIMFKIGQLCDRVQLGRASSLMVMMMYLGMFGCSAWEALVGKLTGDFLYMPLYIGSGIIAFFALIFLAAAIRSAKKERQG
ncbi:MAG: MFS transporter [Mogibacterium sp.]|nr:MFS transporter [Mogibacterium sp.]